MEVTKTTSPHGGTFHGLDAGQKKTEATSLEAPYFFKAELDWYTFSPDKKLVDQGGLPNTVKWEKVVLDFSRCPLTKEHLCELADFIDRQPVLLRHVEMNLSSCRGHATQVGLERLLRSLKNAKDLQALAIDLSGSSFIEEDETLDALGEAVVDLAKLRGVSINIARHSFSSESVAKFFILLSRAKKLSEISLDLSGGRKALDAKTFDKISSYINQSEFLKKLSLDFSYTEGIDDDAAQYFGWILGGMAKKPEEFNVNISGTACTNEGLEKIAASSQSAEIKALNVYAFDAAGIDQNAYKIFDDYSDDILKAKLYRRPRDFA